MYSNELLGQFSPGSGFDKDGQRGTANQIQAVTIIRF
jgi:hypothetical protein